MSLNLRQRWRAPRYLSPKELGQMHPFEASFQEILADPEVREMREEEERAREKKHPRNKTAIPDSSRGEGETEYERFEKLTRQLANTPKPDPDEKESGAA